jgi:hypothetical protein
VLGVGVLGVGVLGVGVLGVGSSGSSGVQAMNVTKTRLMRATIKVLPQRFNEVDLFMIISFRFVIDDAIIQTLKSFSKKKVQLIAPNMKYRLR